MMQDGTANNGYPDPTASPREFRSRLTLFALSYPSKHVRNLRIIF